MNIMNNGKFSILVYYCFELLVQLKCLNVNNMRSLANAVNAIIKIMWCVCWFYIPNNYDMHYKNDTKMCSGWT